MLNEKNHFHSLLVFLGVELIRPSSRTLQLLNKPYLRQLII